MKHISISVLFALMLVTYSTTFGQPNSTALSGVVLDNTSKEVLIGAHIRTNTGTGTTTDASGRFVLPLKGDETYLVISYVSYRNDTIPISSIDQSVELIVDLQALLLQETVVVGRRRSTPGPQDAGVIGITGATLDKLPTVLGEREVMRAVQLLPGVQSGNEGVRGLFVRGGGPDQNLILYEGAPVFNIAHLYGIFSVFNSDIIGKADLHKNHLPAAYGGRLASVLEVDSKTAPMDTSTGGFQIGLFSSKVHFSTPLLKDKISFQSAVRACYAGLFSRPISERQFASSTEAGYITYYFYDINTSLYVRLSDKHQLEAHFFLSDDIYTLYERWGATFPNDDGFRFISDKYSSLRWGNMASSVRWKAHMNERWNYQQDLYVSQYSLRGGDDVFRRFDRADTAINGFYSNISNLSSVLESGIRGHAAFENGKHRFKTGYSALLRSFNTGSGKILERRQGFDATQFSFGEKAQQNFETDLFSEYSLRLNRFRLDIGGRLALYQTDDGFKQLSFQPRAMAEWQIGSGVIWQLSGVRSIQNLHLLTSSAGSILNDIWVPANNFARPEASWQWGSGIRQQFAKGYSWSIDGFYRSLTGAIEYNEGAAYVSFGKDWQRQIAVQGTGRAYGLEFFAAKTAGDLTAWAKYTLSRSERQFDDINRGAWFPFKYDRTHDASLAINYQVSERIDLSLTWVYGTGNAFTLPSSQYPSLQIKDLYQYSPQEIIQTLDGDWGQIRYYEARNNFRLKAFHHLDIGMNYRWNSPKAKHVFNVSVYNLYNRLNVFNVYLKYEQNEDRSFRLVYTTLSLMPLLPSFSYAVTF
jgi:hypothetical protein